MDYNRIVARLIGDLMGLNIKKFREGDVTHEDINRFREGGKILAQLPIYIIDGNITIEKYDAVVREHVEEYGIELAILDYIQIVESTPGAKFANRNLELAHMSKTVMGLGNDTKIHQIVLSQLSRSWAVGKKKVEEPELHHLRDSGSLEQDADVVMFTYLDPDAQGETWENNEPTIFKVAKNRDGPCGKIEMTFQKCFNRFIGSDGEAIPDEMLKAWFGKDTKKEETEDIPF
jgi:replicative DNA helicase